MEPDPTRSPLKHSQPSCLPSSLRSQVVSATAVAWSSAPVVVHRRLIPSPAALRRLHLLNTNSPLIVFIVAWSSTPVALHRTQGFQVEFLRLVEMEALTFLSS
ncbi:uncharacterized protein DS421_16g543670 [Arachis hypogaea]|nr:uncharacterized protein DS421_16g543670 [Arachis hypogaea]